MDLPGNRTMTTGAQIKASRSLLDMTLAEMSAACGISVVTLRAVEMNKDNHHASLVSAYLESQGLYLSETSISTVPFQKDGVNNTSRPLDVGRELSCNPDFMETWNRWSISMCERLRSILEGFHDAGLDIWFVDIGVGQIRVGAKAPGNDRGKPIGFISIKVNGFSFQWAERLRPNPIPESGIELVSAVQSASFTASNIVQIIPNDIKTVAAGRLPMDYRIATGS